MTDSKAPRLTLKPGMSVVVNRAALGSYRMVINGMPGIKVRRTV